LLSISVGLKRQEEDFTVARHQEIEKDVSWVL